LQFAGVKLFDFNLSLKLLLSCSNNFCMASYCFAYTSTYFCICWYCRFWTTGKERGVLEDFSETFSFDN